ncbi:MAG: 4Fe-4S dicluster domain-containing protein [Bacteroidaceae bacterium]|nr:4Fe-4S dicluster domain-containing protein [Bacteroidaceae bacterium]
MVKWCVLIVVIIIFCLWTLHDRVQRGRKKQKTAVNRSRRKFLTMSASLMHDEGTAALAGKVAGGVAAVTGRRNPKSKVRLLPAGAVSEEHFLSKCNACMACVEACPQHVLEPGMSLGEGMSMRLNFRQNGCLEDCVKCNEVCAPGALTAISTEDKKTIQIGHAVWVRENCKAAQGEECTACVDACRNKCIEMIQNGRHFYPIISSEHCTGCGMCEAHCPASPLKAIYVEAFQVHREIMG